MAGSIFPAGADGGTPPLSGDMANFNVSAELKPVPDIAFEALDGTTLSLRAFRGKLLLVNFWATWCGPCRQEMPELDALQAEFGSDRFEVLAIGQDIGGMEKVTGFFADYGIRHLRPLNDRRSASGRSLGVFGLPTTLLIDDEGREIGRLVGPAAWHGPAAKALIRHYLDAAVKT
ncbi:Thiol:disulfide interchange protein TlpA [Oceanibacterium hippocampi]|uniref:Thiol:disulfide interchange protein TlpA n=2 Tax=Oceanibacterium hippocampi TaxID=745714 RepID=A0A1Y5RVJ5_9PROT|nr:Thiol:disulfide interchange protein TlpA [Oceanibacterium hippocampi]